MKGERERGQSQDDAFYHHLREGLDLTLSILPCLQGRISQCTPQGRSDDELNGRTPPKLGSYWKIHPLYPRDVPRAKPRFDGAWIQSSNLQKWCNIYQLRNCAKSFDKRAMLTEPPRKTSEDPVLRTSVGNTLAITMVIRQKITMKNPMATLSYCWHH